MLSSAKLQISESSLMRHRSFMNMLKTKGPRTDPYVYEYIKEQRPSDKLLPID